MGRKKYIIIGGIVVVGLIALCLYIFRPVDDRKLTKQLFGINEDLYKVISRDNQLSKHYYGGSYGIILNIKDNQMEFFLSEIQGAGYSLEDIEESDSIFVRNTTGLELNDKMKVYMYCGSVKRTTSDEFTPKTALGDVVYSDYVNGYYKVYLYYCE